MEPYIFMEKNGIHIIDLQKTVVKIDESAAAIKQIAKSGRKVLFVATKKQAKELVADLVKVPHRLRSFAIEPPDGQTYFLQTTKDLVNLLRDHQRR